jgi:glucan 1,3-beta-glucosidase
VQNCDVDIDLIATQAVPQWHTNQTNIARTNAIVKQLANMFKGNVATVPIIAPLNE